MQIEEADIFRSASRADRCLATPSTSALSGSKEKDGPLSEPEIGEFDLCYETLHLSKLMSVSSLNQKENEKHVTDRFIPLRRASSARVDNFGEEISNEMEKKPRRGQQIKETKVTLDEMYKKLLLDKNQNKLLSFGDTKTSNQLMFKEASNKFFNQKALSKKNKVENRNISKIPFKVLDAPSLQDDFYLNLLEWSPTNILSVALDSSLYMWNANNNKVLRFCDLNPASISSLTWNSNGTQISIGNSLGVIETWDFQRNRKVG